MEFIDLKTQQARIKPGLDKRLQQVLAHGRYILGPEVFELEEQLAEYVGVRHCVSCASGTDALLMGLLALEVGPGDAVFVPSFTFVASAEVVVLAGATPVFVDIDSTFNIDPQALQQAVSTVKQSRPDLKPRGIITVDLFGQPASYEEINSIAEAENLFVMEDAAQSFGAAYREKKAGALAPLAAVSFFPAKPLGCYGDGGAVFCDDDGLAAVLRSIRVHGQGENRYDNVRIGINGRCDTMQAAVLLEKLPIFDEELKLRNEAAARYSSALSEKFTVPHIQSDRTSVWAQYSLLTGKRDECLESLKNNDIPAAVYYPQPLHQQAAYKARGITPLPMPVSDKACREIFSIPMHPYLKVEDQERIVGVLLDAAAD